MEPMCLQRIRSILKALNHNDANRDDDESSSVEEEEEEEEKIELPKEAFVYMPSYLYYSDMTMDDLVGIVLPQCLSTNGQKTKWRSLVSDLKRQIGLISLPL